MQDTENRALDEGLRLIKPKPQRSPTRGLHISPWRRPHPVSRRSYVHGVYRVVYFNQVWLLLLPPFLVSLPFMAVALEWPLRDI